MTKEKEIKLKQLLQELDETDFPDLAKEIIGFLNTEWFIALDVIAEQEKTIKRQQKELQKYHELDLIKAAMNAAIDGAAK